MTILTAKSNARKPCSNCAFLVSFHLFLFYYILNLRIIILQHCVDFWHASTWINHRYIHISPSSWTSIPPPTPSHPSRASQSTGFELPTSYSKFPLDICFTYGNVYVSVLVFQLVPPSPSPDNHDDVTTHLELDILECEVKGALGSILRTKLVEVMEFQLIYFKS